MIFPYFSDTLTRAEEKQKVISVLSSISRLRKAAISYLVVAEITIEGDDLVLYLDNREIERIYLPGTYMTQRSIFFNRHGITAGGDITIRFKKKYRITVQEVSGKTSLVTDQ